MTHDILPTVQADPSQVPQLLENLLSNALKFRGLAHPEIHVSACRRGDDWVFSIQDNGIGIDPAYQNDLFKIFHRFHGQNEYPSTGVGLAICKKIVEGHGGRIWVESQPGKGSIFFSLSRQYRTSFAFDFFRLPYNLMSK